MTVTKATPLLISFRSKIEESVSLVPRMCAEEKLKAVQFWNMVSERLQEIVNSSAADFQAIALKMREEEEKLSLDIINPSSSFINENNLSSDFITNPAHCFSASGEHNVDFSTSHYDNAFSTSTFLSNEQPQNYEIINTFIEKQSHMSGDLGKSESACQSILDIATNNCDILRHPETDIETEILKNDSYVSLKASDHDNRLLQSSERSKYDDSLREGDSFTSASMNCLVQGNGSKTENLEDATGRLSGSCKESDSEDESNFVPGVDVDESNEASLNQDLAEEPLEKSTTSNDSNEKLKTDFTPYDKKYSCTDCLAVFATRTNLNVHMRRHTGEKPYICDQCPARFSTNGNRNRHKKKHTGEKPWKCSECGVHFTEKKGLTCHMRTHTGEKPYQCNECGKSFAQTGGLQLHILVHKNLKTHLCELCGKSFRQKTQLSMHKLRHDKVKKFRCEICPARFLTRGDLTRHGLKHTGEKPFGCLMCPKMFTRRLHLDDHVNRHNGIKPHSCDSCGKAYFEKSALRKHLKEHQKAQDLEDL